MESGYTPQPLPTRLRAAVGARGLRPVGGDFARWGTRLVAGLAWTLRGRRGTFAFRGERHPYLVHRHKRTWLTERAVEVPVVQAIVDRHAGARVLEVGNVLSHYRPQRHLVVDKYERAPGVVNRDVLELGDLGRFDLVVAISTVEHVGWDETPRDPAKAVAAIGALRSLLAPGGTLVVTVPVGYNRALDAALRDGQVSFSELTALRRSGGTSWREARPEEVWAVPYDFLMYSARAVLFGFAGAEVANDPLA
jgi:SAM-dependent methyltransferase